MVVQRKFTGEFESTHEYFVYLLTALQQLWRNCSSGTNAGTFYGITHSTSQCDVASGRHSIISSGFE